MQIASSPTPPAWDFEWTYEDGLPDSNGFTKTTSGTNSATLRDTDVRLYVKGSSAAIRYIYGQNNTVSVVEAEFMITSNNGIAYVTLYDGNSNIIGVRCQYSSNYKGVYLMTSTSIGSMTKLQTIALSTRYKVRLVLDGSYGYVYVDDVLKADAVDLSTIQTSIADTRFSFGDASTSAVYCNLYSIKLKLGRT